jgi:hypothetical protein
MQGLIVQLEEGLDVPVCRVEVQADLQLPHIPLPKPPAGGGRQHTTKSEILRG